MKTEKRDLGYYIALPYTKSLRPDRDGDVVAQIRELQGWSAHGQDERDAVARQGFSQPGTFCPLPVSMRLYP